MEILKDPKSAGSIAKRNGPNPFFSPKPVQAKLEVNFPGDVYEVEADQVAERVLEKISDSNTTENSIKQKASSTSESINQSGISNPLPTSPSKNAAPNHIQTKCEDCEAEEMLGEEEVQRKVDYGISLQAAETDDEDPSLMTKRSSTLLPTVSQETTAQLFASKGGGNPLQKNTRAEMERGFGVDFSGVRIHDGPSAAKMSKNLGAQAFTHGSDIYFNQGKFDTQSKEGKRLLAHELTHVVQRSKGNFSFKDTVSRQADLGKIPDLSDRVDEDKNLYYLGNGRKKRIVDRHFLAHLAYAIGAERLESEILSSHSFIGTASVRKDWATFLKANIDDLLEYEGFRLYELQKQLEDENNKRKLEEHKGTPAKKIFFKFGSGFAIAEYNPAQSLLLITVPIQFDFLSSQYTQSVPVGDLKGSRPVTMVEQTKTISWGGTEEEDWKMKFISLVESSWSTTKTNHTIFNTEPTLKDLKVSVKVGIKEFKSDDEVPAEIEVFKAKIYRDEIPANYCSGRKACLNKKSLFLPYNSISESAGRLAIHEFGHVLGLGDEYFDSDKPNEKKATHSGSVRSEFGYGVSRIDSEKAERFKTSIMDRGNVVLIEHGVVFLDAMTKITKSNNWTLKSHQQP